MFLTVLIYGIIMNKMLNKISKTDFDKICRTCLQRNEKMHELCTFADVLSELADIKVRELKSYLLFLSLLDLRRENP